MATPETFNLKACTPTACGQAGFAQGFISSSSGLGAAARKALEWRVVQDSSGFARFGALPV
jgi:hypothetical protein